MNLKKFFSELKRRNVYKVAIAYSITSWLAAQMASLAADSFDAPDWVMKMIIVILVIGFPIALILAWAFEMSPEGIIRTASIESKENPFSDNKKKPFTGKLLIGILLLTLVGQFAYNKYSNKGGVDRVKNDVVNIDKSIAVLPFDDMSPNHDKEYFSDGMMEEILNHLYKIGDLKVTSKTSSMQYKGEQNKSVQEIANELGVEHILEGSVRLDGDKVRITVQLIKASTDEHLFAENYDRLFSDIFSIQSEVAQEVAKALKAKISPEAQRIIESKPTENIEAYNLYLKAMELNRYVEKENNEAILLYKRALELDPNFSALYAGIGLRLSIGATYLSGSGTRDPQEAWNISKPYYEKAIQLDPDNGNAHLWMAWSLLWYEWNFEEAEKEYEETKRIFPNYSWTDFLLAKGQYTKAYEGAIKNVEIDSRNVLARTGVITSSYFDQRDAENAIKDALTSPIVREDIILRSEAARIYLYLEKYKDAISVSQQLQKDFPKLKSSRLSAIEAISYYQTNRPEETQRIIEELIAKSKDNAGGSPSFYLAMIYSQMGKFELAFQWLEKSYDDHEVEMYWLKVEPPFEPIRNDKRYFDLINRIGYTE